MFDKKEFRDLANTIMQVEYLLLSLVLLYIAIPGTTVENKYAVILMTVIYALVLIIFQYIASDKISPTTMSIRSIIMVAFISVVIWHTGRSISSLLILYAFSVVASAMVLGKMTTGLLVTLISLVLIFFDFYDQKFTLDGIQIDSLLGLVMYVFTLVLLSYLTHGLSLQMQKAKQQIKNSSELDRLTGALNMRTFSFLWEKEQEKFIHYSKHCAVLVIDVDNIKTINDAYGYVTGDRIMILIANIAKRTLRGHDLLARHSSDKFIALLAEADEEAATSIAAKICNTVETTPIIIEGGKEVFVTVSVGTAVYPADHSDFDEVIKLAEMAMFSAKDQGKNRCISYHALITGDGQAVPA